MKNKIIIVILILLLGSCVSNVEYTYKLTYTDGTEETVISKGKFETQSGSDCITTCGCSNGASQKYCGVRKFVLISERNLDEKKQTTSYTPDDF